LSFLVIRFFVFWGLCNVYDFRKVIFKTVTFYLAWAGLAAGIFIYEHLRIIDLVRLIVLRFKVFLNLLNFDQVLLFFFREAYDILCFLKVRLFFLLNIVFLVNNWRLQGCLRSIKERVWFRMLWRLGAIFVIYFYLFSLWIIIRRLLELNVFLKLFFIRLEGVIQPFCWSRRILTLLHLVSLLLQTLKFIAFRATWRLLSWAKAILLRLSNDSKWIVLADQLGENLATIIGLLLLNLYHCWLRFLNFRILNGLDLWYDTYWILRVLLLLSDRFWIVKFQIRHSVERGDFKSNDLLVGSVFWVIPWLL